MDLHSIREKKRQLAMSLIEMKDDTLLQRALAAAPGDYRSVSGKLPPPPAPRSCAAAGGQASKRRLELANRRMEMENERIMERGMRLDQRPIMLDADPSARYDAYNNRIATHANAMALQNDAMMHNARLFRNGVLNEKELENAVARARSAAGAVDQVRFDSYKPKPSTPSPWTPVSSKYVD